MKSRRDLVVSAIAMSLVLVGMWLIVKGGYVRKPPLSVLLTSEFVSTEPLETGRTLISHELINQSKWPIEVLRIARSCSCMTVEMDESPIVGFGKRLVQVEIASSERFEGSSEGSIVLVYKHEGLTKLYTHVINLEGSPDTKQQEE